MMYDFIEKDQYLSPEESLKKYLYFSGEDELPREQEPVPEPQLISINVTDLHRNDFEELLRNSDLPQEQKKHYHAQFVKTKRIYKREKAKMRYGGPQSLAWLPVELPVEHFVEDRAVEEHSTTKAESDIPDKDEDQKRKKRMSAQISRDRKKLYIESIEAENRELRQRTAVLEADNLTLHKQIEAMKKKDHPKLDTSIKSFFIMSLILLTSVNKHIHRLDAQLNLSQETLLKHAADILSEYSRTDIKITLPQIEEFKRQFTYESELKLEEELKVEPEPTSTKPTIFSQSFHSRSSTTGGKKGAHPVVRRVRGRQGKTILARESC